MIQRTTPAPSVFPSLRASLFAGAAFAALAFSTLTASAQTAPDATNAPVPAATDATPAAAPSAPPVAASANLSNQPASKTRKAKDDKVVQSKDTKKEVKRYNKDNPLEGVDAKLPDKQLYDKAMDSIKRGRFDVARLDLQTLLNTYPDSQFQMRAKLAIADSWYKEGGSAALTQAEQEYRDFIVFYPNQPEAAEAQMRIGDIYFKEMDKPDRDHTKAVHAEEEYRLMLQQFPDSVRIPEAAQRLREVQESLASAEADVASFYASRQNWAAAIARYQTVADTYGLYSHMDDVLIALGDAYEEQAKFYRLQPTCVNGQPHRGPCLPEAAKAQMVKLNEDQAAAAWRKVVLEHSAAPHVEDARDRLAALNLPIPTPTKEQMAASEALENSRGQYTLSKRALVLVLHRPDVVQASTVGEPSLQDPARTLAPTITRRNFTELTAAVNGGVVAPAAAPALSAANPAAQTPAAEPPSPASSPLQLQDVPTANGVSSGPSVSNVPAGGSSVPASGTGIGAEIVQPSGNSPAPTQPSSTPPAFPGGGSATPPQSSTPAPAGAIPAAAFAAPGTPPAASTEPLAPIEKAPAAPVAINEATPGSQPAAQTPTGKKNPKPAFDKSDESSSKHKKKKGLDKLNPF